MGIRSNKRKRTKAGDVCRPTLIFTSYAGGIVGAGRNMTLTSDDEWVEDATVNW